MTRLSLIVAMDENGLIGRDNDLPWRLPNDLRYFKQTTMGKPIVMGRKSYESIGKPLAGRQNIVLTRDPDWQAQGCTVVTGLDAAVQAAADAGEVMVIGGAQVYEQALPLAQRIYLTRIHARFEGDTWFPALPADQWREVSRQDHAADERNAWPHSFLVLERTANVE